MKRITQSRIFDLVGRQFGGLVVRSLDRYDTSAKRRSWNVDAVCGHSRTIVETHLLNNPPTNCAKGACRYPLLVVDGIHITQQELATRLGCSDSAIQMRFKAGWTLDEVIAGRRANGRRVVTVKAFGATLTISQLARAAGVDYPTIRERLKRGWSAEEAIVGKRAQAR